jgi:hypothetical protein
MTDLRTPDIYTAMNSTDLAVSIPPRTNREPSGRHGRSTLQPGFSGAAPPSPGAARELSRTATRPIVVLIVFPLVLGLLLLIGVVA